MNPLAGFGPDATHSSPTASATAVAAICATVSDAGVAVTVGATDRGVLVKVTLGNPVAVAAALATAVLVGEVATSAVGVAVDGPIVGTVEAATDDVELGTITMVEDGLTARVGATVGAKTTVDVLVTDCLDVLV